MLDCHQFLNEILEKEKVADVFNFQFIFFVYYSVGNCFLKFSELGILN